MASHIGRRKFLATLGGAAAAWPLAARAQQFDRNTRRVSVLTAFAENDRDAQANMTAFRQALEKLGWGAHAPRLSGPQRTASTIAGAVPSPNA